MKLLKTLAIALYVVSVGIIGAALGQIVRLGWPEWSFRIASEISSLL